MRRSRSPSAFAKSGPWPSLSPATSLTPARSKSGDLHAGVLQRVQAQLAYVVDPCCGAGEVLVVAGDEVRAVAGPQPRRAARPRGRGRATVPSTRSPTTAIRSGWVRVDRVDDPLGVGAAQDRAEVDVADHGDAEAVGGRGQPGERDGDPLDRGPRSTPYVPWPTVPSPAAAAAPADGAGDEEPARGAGDGRAAAGLGAAGAPVRRAAAGSARGAAPRDGRRRWCGLAGGCGRRRGPAGRGRPVRPWSARRPGPAGRAVSRSVRLRGVQAAQQRPDDLADQQSQQQIDRASQRKPGQASTCWSGKGAPARSATRAATPAAAARRSATVPARRTRPARGRRVAEQPAPHIPVGRQRRRPGPVRRRVRKR